MLKDELLKDVQRHLRDAFSEEYAQSIPQSTVEAIAENVMETSAYEEGYWSNTDIQYATARVLLPKQKQWKVPVVWSMMGHLVVTAATEEEAIQKAILMADDSALPEDGYYLEDSFEVDEKGCVTEI